MVTSVREDKIRVRDHPSREQRSIFIRVVCGRKHSTLTKKSPAQQNGVQKQNMVVCVCVCKNCVQEHTKLSYNT